MFWSETWGLHTHLESHNPLWAWTGTWTGQTHIILWYIILWIKHREHSRTVSWKYSLILTLMAASHLYSYNSVMFIIVFFQHLEVRTPALVLVGMLSILVRWRIQAGLLMFKMLSTGETSGLKADHFRPVQQLYCSQVKPCCCAGCSMWFSIILNIPGNHQWSQCYSKTPMFSSLLMEPCKRWKMP